MGQFNTSLRVSFVSREKSVEITIKPRIFSNGYEIIAPGENYKANRILIAEPTFENSAGRAIQLVSLGSRALDVSNETSSIDSEENAL
jgi:hypothetical protein